MLIFKFRQAQDKGYGNESSIQWQYWWDESVLNKQGPHTISQFYDKIYSYFQMWYTFQTVTHI